MHISQGVEWGTHCAVVLSWLSPDEALPASRLAEFHGVPAAYLSKHLQAMARAGIVETVRGPGGGYRLARPAAAISVLDVVEAIDGLDPAFRCEEIRRRGPTASPARYYSARCGVHAAMLAADVAWRAELKRTTIADLAAGAVRDSHPKVVEKGLTWLQEVLAR
jgi:Rrf2 family protein